MSEGLGSEVRGSGAAMCPGPVTDPKPHLPFVKTCTELLSDAKSLAMERAMILFSNWAFSNSGFSFLF